MGGACSTYEEKTGACRIWCGNLSEKENLGDPGVDGKIILRWIFRNLDVGAWTGLLWFRIGTGGGHF
jgi:hypothetical protein